MPAPDMKQDVKLDHQHLHHAVGSPLHKQVQAVLWGKHHHNGLVVLLVLDDIAQSQVPSIVLAQQLLVVHAQVQRGKRELETSGLFLRR